MLSASIILQFGAVSALRLVTSKTGASKGFAYVEMGSAADAANAIAKGHGMVLKAGSTVRDGWVTRRRTGPSASSSPRRPRRTNPRPRHPLHPLHR